MTHTGIAQTQFIIIAAGGGQVVFGLTDTAQLAIDRRFAFQAKTEVALIAAELVIAGTVIQTGCTTVDIKLGTILVIHIGCGG